MQRPPWETPDLPDILELTGKCGSCLYWDKMTHSGECSNPDLEPDILGARVVTEPDSHCGEWEASLDHVMAAEDWERQGFVVPDAPVRHCPARAEFIERVIGGTNALT